MLDFIDKEPLISKLLETNKLMISDLGLFVGLCFISTKEKIKEIAEKKMEALVELLPLPKSIKSFLNEPASCNKNKIQSLKELCKAQINDSLLKDKTPLSSLEAVKITEESSKSKSSR